MSLPHYYHSTLTRKGQATIPIEIRDKLGMNEGDRLVWQEIDGEVTVVTAREHVRRTSAMLKPFIDPTIPSPSLEEIEETIEAAVLERYEKTLSQR